LEKRPSKFFKFLSGRGFGHQGVVFSQILIRAWLFQAAGAAFLIFLRARARCFRVRLKR